MTNERVLKEASEKRFNGKTKRIVCRILLYAVLVVLLLYFMLPFVIMLLQSFMTKEEVIMDLPERIFSSAPSLQAYGTWLQLSYLKNLGNTFAIIILNMIGIPLSASLCAFGFSKLKFHGNGFMFAVVLSTLMLPSIGLQIPLYMLYYKFGWTNTIIPLFLPAWFGGGAINIFLMVQFMRGIHNDIIDAARIDGANMLRTFFQIVLPLCRPMLTLIMVQTFFAGWNDYSGALMYLAGSSRDNYTLALALFYDFQNASVLLNAKMAAGVLVMIPCFIIFAIFQKYMIFGVNVGAVKG